METLRVWFCLHDRTLFATVLRTPERLRGKGELASGGGYGVMSLDRPALTESSLYLAGTDRDADSQGDHFNYDTPEEARDARDAFTALIRQINSEPQPQPATDDCECTIAE